MIQFNGFEQVAVCTGLQGGTQVVFVFADGKHQDAGPGRRFFEGGNAVDTAHAGQVVVADGTAEAAARLERVLTNDPAMGVFRHADAGYELAAECAVEQGLDVPMA